MDNRELQCLIEEYDNFETKVFDSNYECVEFLDNNFLTVLNMNIRSIGKNFDELYILIESLNTVSLDIIVLTETWENYNIDNFILNGYKNYYSTKYLNQNDGVVIFVKNDISVLCMNAIDNLEVCTLRMVLLKSNIKFGLTAVYRLHENNVNNFNANLQNYLKLCSEPNEIFLGDINIDLLDKSIPAHEYLNILIQHRYKCLINECTREHNGSRSCIDHIFFKTSTPQNKFKAAVYRTTITDHYTTVFGLQNKIFKNYNSITKPSSVITFKMDNTKFRNFFNIETFVPVLNASQPDTAVETLIHLITDATAKATVQNVVKLNSKTRKRKSWITLGIIKCINKRNALKKLLNKDITNINLKEYYIRYRNILHSSIKTAKANYYSNLVNKAPNNLKHIWKIVKSSLKNDEPNENISGLVLDNGTVIDALDHKAIADTFNDHYCTVGKRMAEKLMQNPLLMNKEPKNTKVHDRSMFLYPVTREEITTYINELKNGKATGCDNIKVEHIKTISNFIAPALEHIANLILTTGIFPNQLKTAVVIPIFKSGSKKVVSNYRPISLITHIAKIIEKVIKNRLTNYIEQNNLLSFNQFGFREGLGTENAIRLLTSEIYDSLDRSENSAAVFLDLAKAFDTVSHPILLDKLSNIGIRGLALDLFSSYLNGRSQQVKIKNTLSDTNSIEYGVPQGTVLGPILFLIYINDLLKLPVNGSIISYADDTVFYVKGGSWSDIKLKLTHGMQKITEWLNTNLLTLNYEKTKIVAFTSYKTNLPDYQNIQIKNNPNNCNFEISLTNQIKYLGLVLDSCLKWEPHITTVTAKVRKLLFIFKHLKTFMNFKQLKQIYHALVESVLRYGICGWGGLYKTALTPLNVTQNAILKIILSKPFLYPTSQLYKEADLCTVRQLFIISAVRYAYLQKNVILINHNYATRAKTNQQLQTSKAYKTIGQRTETYVASRFFNLLPEWLQTKPSLHSFTRSLKKYLIDTDMEPYYAILHN